MNSPTLSIHATQAGIILGTAAYMSPEQARGKMVDKRTDIWALGCVLFEMLTGTRAFPGEDATDTIVAVVSKEPDWSALPTAVPFGIRQLLRRTLEKDPRRRLDSAAAVRIEIDDASNPPNLSNLPNASNLGTRPWAVLASFVIGGLVIGAAVWVLMRSAGAVAPGGVVRFAIHDTDQLIVSTLESDMALSPDGRMLAFVGYGDGAARIWIRTLDATEARLLPGTEGAGSLCWSPDSESLAFNAFRQIKKIAVAGGAPQVIAATRGGPLAWGPDGSILSADSRGLSKVIASTGSATILIPVAPGESHASPEFLPDGRHFLIAIRSQDPAKAGTFAVAIDGGSRSRILAFPTTARYVMGRLLFVRDRVLYAQVFDLQRLQLKGDPVRVADAATFSASANGALVYVPLITADQALVQTQLAWMDRGGRVTGRIDQAAGASRPVLSPDTRRLAMLLRGDIWILELERGVLSRVTSGGAQPNHLTWLPDSQRIMFTRAGFRNGKDFILETLAGSAGKETIVLEPAGDHAHLSDISADGRYLTYEGDPGSDVWVMPLAGDRSARAFVEGPAVETQGAFSPDGRWLAYTSDSSGRFEVFVQSFPEPGPRIQVSPDGGTNTRWRRDGKELFYVAMDGTLMAVPVRAAQPIEFGRPAALFQFYSPVRGIPAGKPPYDVMPDGQRFIVSSVVRRTDPSLHVLLNWPALLKKSN
jgi:Tol biopolymer transport system component